MNSLIASDVMKGLEVRENLDVVVAQMLEHEQAPCPIVHRFGPGVYVREMTVQAGVIVVGHKHKFEHLCELVTGRALFLNEDGSTTEMAAPQMFVAKPGNKIAFVIEEMTFRNIFATDETDVEKLEAQLIDKSDARNEHLAMRCSELKRVCCDDDKDDFRQAIAEFGFTEDEVWRISRDESDLIGMPHGGFKIKVGDSRIQGRGILATAEIEAEEVIAPAVIGGKRTPAGRYTNHSKHPNARMARGPDGNIYLVATRSIAGCRGGHDGEEITVDYRQVLGLRLTMGAEV